MGARDSAERTIFSLRLSIIATNGKSMPARTTRVLSRMQLPFKNATHTCNACNNDANTNASQDLRLSL